MQAEKTIVRLPQAPPDELESRARAITESAPAAALAPDRGPFVPLLLGGLALLGTLAFQSVQLLADRLALQTAHASQQQTVDNAGKLRQALDLLAADTQRMADTGNANARVLVEELKKRGVTINAATAAATK